MWQSNLPCPVWKDYFAVSCVAEVFCCVLCGRSVLLCPVWQKYFSVLNEGELRLILQLMNSLNSMHLYLLYVAAVHAGYGTGYDNVRMKIYCVFKWCISSLHMTGKMFCEVCNSLK